MKISIIAAVPENRVIGNEAGEMPWHLPEDLKRFKKITTGHCVLMGYMTFKSIGKPLPKRTNIVLSRKKDLKIDGALVLNSFDRAIKFVKERNETELFIIGGAQIYEQAMPIADKLYITFIYETFEGNTFMPPIPLKEWETTNVKNCKKDAENPYYYSFLELERVKNETQKS